jgi:predicted DNA-binding WGR domain protein
MSKTYMEFRDDKSTKFWEVTVAGARHLIRSGKLGTSGKVQMREFSDGATAKKHADRLIKENAEKKGYVVLQDNSTEIDPDDPMTLFLEARARIAAVRRKYANECWIEDLEPYFKDVEAGGVGWVFEHKAVAADQASRRKSMFPGPFFTSASYPWPMKNGKHAVPIIQVDLRELAALSGEELGDGLLQIWLHDYPSTLERVVPRVSVDNDALAEDVPTALSSMDKEFGSYSRHFLQPDGEVEQIVGYGPPILSVYADCDAIEYALGYELPPEIERLRTILEKIKGNTSEHHAFGSFTRIQQGPGEVGKVLIALESTPPFFWGRGGNAQVFYEFKKKGPYFWFNWSN